MGAGHGLVGTIIGGIIIVAAAFMILNHSANFGTVLKGATGDYQNFAAVARGK